MDRRNFIRSMIGAGIGLAVTPLLPALNLTTEVRTGISAYSVAEGEIIMKQILDAKIHAYFSMIAREWRLLD